MTRNKTLVAVMRRLDEWRIKRACRADAIAFTVAGGWDVSPGQVWRYRASVRAEDTYTAILRRMSHD